MGEGGNCQDIAQKEYADYSDSQADICLQCYNTDVAKKKRNENQRSHWDVQIGGQLVKHSSKAHKDSVPQNHFIY